MARLELNSCPRCRGDLHVNGDLYGAYKQCLQCGHMENVDDPDRLASLLEFAGDDEAT